MPQIGFFVGAAGAGLFGIPMGAANLTIAWDSFGTGPGSSLGLVYKTYMLSNIVGGGRVRHYKPVTVAPRTGIVALEPVKGKPALVRLRDGKAVVPRLDGAPDLKEGFWCAREDQDTALLAATANDGSKL